MVRYQRLTLMEREEISRLLAVGHSLRATAHVLVYEKQCLEPFRGAWRGRFVKRRS
jgi:hypothetical protein